MARVFPLEAVRFVAHERAEAAARELGGHGRRVSAARDKLDQLAGFRAQYRVQRDSLLFAGVDTARVRDFDAFLGRLDEAIQTQGEELARLEAGFEAARGRWLELRRREQAMDALAARHDEIEAARARRLDQKEQDEFSQRASRALAKVRLG